MIYRNLPAESATMTAVRNAASPDEIADAAKGADPAQGRWSHDQMLAAAQLDVLRQLLHILPALHGAKVGSPPPPTPRPGVAGAKKRKRTPPELRRVLDPRMRQTTPREG